MKLPSHYLKEMQSQRKYLSNMENATKYFESQSNAIKGIKDTTGYKEIKDYRARVYDAAVQRLGEVDPTNVGKVAYFQAEVSIAKSFLDFLDNIVA